MPKTSAALVLCLVAAACASTPGDPGATINADSLLAHIRTLASDDFGGRAPGSPGEDKTVAYLTDQFKAIGLAPGNPDGSFVQRVPLVGITADRSSTLELTRGSTARTLEPVKDFVAWTKRVVDSSSLDADMVFVGYGVVAPEYGWDDYKDVDVRGKTLVMLVGDPPGDDIFGGKAMTYYGRWTYKFEIAAERGAAGAFIIHDTQPAGYPWEVVTGSWSGEQFDLVTPDKNMARAAVEGWLHFDQAAALFESADLNLDAQMRAARDRAFRPVPLGVRASTTITNMLRTVNSNNVVARLEGRTRPGEHVVYMAHWDHLGTDPSIQGDGIFNGAEDNASGTAGLLELAKAFSSMPQRPERSLLFLAVTAEEQGLLGSRYYAEHPLYPPATTVAALNMDGLNVVGRTRDLTVVGMGQSSLDGLAARIAQGQKRVLRSDPEPEKGFYYRSDHFQFAKAGIPAFYFDAGIDVIDKPTEYGMKAREKYTAEDYHKPSDEVKDSWDLSGAVDDLRLLFSMGYELASGTDWPQWSQTSEFRAKRELQKAGS